MYDKESSHFGKVAGNVVYKMAALLSKMKFPWKIVVCNGLYDWFTQLKRYG